MTPGTGAPRLAGVGEGGEPESGETGTPPVADVPSDSGSSPEPGDGTDGAVQAAEHNVTGVAINHDRVTVPLIAGTTLTATAQPANATNVTFSIAAGTAPIAAGTTIDPASGVITVAADQEGGSISVRATSNNATSSAYFDQPFHFVEIPAGIESTWSEAHPTQYGGDFTHTLEAPSGRGNALFRGRINERFDSHEATTPWGQDFALSSNAGTSRYWPLDDSGTMTAPDHVTLQKTGRHKVDARSLIASASNPTPTHTPTAQFTMTQKLRPHDFPGDWSDTDFTTVDHIRGVREDAGDLEVFATVNGETEAAQYEGPAAYRNLAASPTTVEASAPAPTDGSTTPDPNTVDFTAEVLPNSATMKFSIVDAALGCTIDADSGELTVGTTAGTVKVRVSDGSRRPGHYDELDLTITARPTPAPEAPSEGEEGAPTPAPESGSDEPAPEAEPAPESTGAIPDAVADGDDAG